MVTPPSLGGVSVFHKKGIVYLQKEKKGSDSEIWQQTICSVWNPPQKPTTNAVSLNNGQKQSYRLYGIQQ